MHVSSEISNGVVSRSLPNGYVEVRLPDGTVRSCFVSVELRKVGTIVWEGDHVLVGVEEDGVFRGEITRVWQPEAAAQPGTDAARTEAGEAADVDAAATAAEAATTRTRPEPAPPRASLIARSDASGLKPQEQRIDRQARPGWPTGAECAPRIGDVVYCTAGLATVLRVLGRTGNGSRLLELRLPAAGKVSFFASGSNVLMAPRQDAPVAAEGSGTP